MNAYSVSETCSVTRWGADSSDFYAIWRVMGPSGQIVVDNLNTKAEAKHYADLLNAAYEEGKAGRLPATSQSVMIRQCDS